MSNKRLIYLLFFLLLTFLVIFLPGKLIKIKTIDCASQYGPCDAELSNGLNQLMGKDLGSALKGTRKMLSSTLTVHSYSLQFKLPSKLRIDIVLRKPKFALNKVGSNDYVLIDKDGMVLETQNLTNLPTLKISDELPGVGQAANERLLFALNITYDMYAFYQVKSAKIDNDSLVVELSRQPVVIFPLEGDKDALLGGLALIISRLNKISEDSKIVTVKEIDLRFKNPVVR